MRANMIWAAAMGVALMSGFAHAQDNSAAINLIRKESSTCHGARGISVSPTFPNLAGQQAPYLEAQLKAFRDRSRADPHAQAFMWGMAAQLTDDTIKGIADYLAAQPPASGTRAGPAEIAAGKKIYEEGIPTQNVASSAVGRRDDLFEKRLVAAGVGDDGAVADLNLVLLCADDDSAATERAGRAGAPTPTCRHGVERRNDP